MRHESQRLTATAQCFCNMARDTLRALAVLIATRTRVGTQSSIDTATPCSACAHSPSLGCKRLCGRLVQRPHFFNEYYTSNVRQDAVAIY